MRLDGKRMVVTGATRGIGRALTAALLEKGVSVVGVGRDAEALAEMAKQPGFTPLACDLGDMADRVRLLGKLSAEGPIDGLINNAGIQVASNYAVAGEDPGAGIRREVEINLTAPMHLAAALLPVLGQRPEAVIVNITSGLALAPKLSAPVYCATKAALKSFTLGLRYQAKGLPVQVIEAVMPLVDTNMTAGRGADKIPPEAAAQALLAGLESGEDEIWIGKTRQARILHRVAPGLLQRLLRNG